jgi:membrane-bound lytic murein transglycosylase B
LLSKKNKEYKLGYKNFKVIMSYNPSTFYAMVVSELSEKISQKKWN